MRFARAAIWLGVLSLVCNAAWSAETGTLAPTTSDLFNLPPAESELLWKWKAPSASIDQLYLANQAIFAISDSAGFWRLSDKGYPLWYNATPHAEIVGGYLDQLWVSSDQQVLAGVDQTYGYVRWQHRFAQPLISNVFTYNQSVWVVDASHDLWRIDAINGQRTRWMSLSDNGSKIWLGSGAQRELVAVGQRWQAIDVERKQSRVLAGIPLPDPVAAHWMNDLSGIYFLDNNRQLVQFGREKQWARLPFGTVDDLWMLSPGKWACYQEEGRKLSFFKDGKAIYSCTVSSRPLAVAQSESFFLIFLPKGEVQGIDERKRQKVFTINLGTPPGGTKMWISDDSVYYLNYEGAVVGAMIVVDLF